MTATDPKVRPLVLDSSRVVLLLGGAVSQPEAKRILLRDGVHVTELSDRRWIVLESAFLAWLEGRTDGAPRGADAQGGAA